MVIATYNANNARNLVAFSALLGLMPGRMDFPPFREAKSVPDAPFGHPVPPLPPFGTLPEPLQQAIHRLNRFGDTGEQGAPLASLYVHLSLWPEMLAYVECLLKPLDAAGTLTSWRVETADRAAMAPLSDLRAPAELRAVLEPILGALVGRTIPKMVPIGTYLGRALKPGQSGWQEVRAIAASAKCYWPQRAALAQIFPSNSFGPALAGSAHNHRGISCSRMAWRLLPITGNSGFSSMAAGHGRGRPG